MPSNKGGVGKTSHFLALNVNISKTALEIWPKLLLITNRKLLMRFRLIPRSMTLDDHDLLKVRILSEFRGILQIWEPTAAKRMKIGPSFGEEL